MKLQELRKLIKEETSNIFNLQSMIEEFSQTHRVQTHAIEEFLELYVNKDFLSNINFRDKVNVSEFQITRLTKDLVINDDVTDVGIMYEKITASDESYDNFEFIEDLKEIVAENIKINLGIHIEW